jgi:hypothetical protein
METDLDTINKLIATKQRDLKVFNEEKEKVFKRIRLIREARNKQ